MASTHSLSWSPCYPIAIGIVTWPSKSEASFGSHASQLQDVLSTWNLR